MGFKRLKLVLQLQPKLRNVNLHNITHSIISPNPRDRMVAVHISLLIVTFLSLVSRIVSLMQTINEVNPHPRIASCANMWSVIFFFFSFSSYGTCWMLVHTYAISSGKAKLSRPHQWRWEENEFKFHSVTCNTNRIVSRIHVKTIKLSSITCSLVATDVILQCLECA